MEWQVVFYKEKSGIEPVKEFILSLPDRSIAEILHVLRLLREFNVSLGLPYVKKVDKSGLRELRVKHSTDIYRIFFIAYIDNKLVLLHGFQKKTGKTPEKELGIARKRMQDLLEDA